MNNKYSISVVDSSMFLHSLLRRLTDSVSSEVEDSDHDVPSPLLPSPEDPESQPEPPPSKEHLNELKKLKLKRISLIISITFVAVVVLSVVIYFILQGLSLAIILLSHHKISCAEGDLECEGLRCPTGMHWSSTDSHCTVETDFECCTTSNMTRTCYSPQLTTPTLQNCSNASKSAGVAPFIKQYCRPGYVWVEWLEQCLGTEGRG